MECAANKFLGFHWFSLLSNFRSSFFVPNLVLLIYLLEALWFLNLLSFSLLLLKLLQKLLLELLDKRLFLVVVKILILNVKPILSDYFIQLLSHFEFDSFICISCICSTIWRILAKISIIHKVKHVLSTFQIFEILMDLNEIIFAIWVLQWVNLNGLGRITRRNGITIFFGIDLTLFELIWQFWCLTLSWVA